MSQMLYKEASCKTAKDIPTKPSKMHDGLFHYIVIAESEAFEDDIAAAHADGWHDTTPEAAKGAKPKAKKKATAKKPATKE